ncbi:hypothetical protein [Wolbachia endosymbiont of Laodelphax striatellus]|uniref:hypothetical protein n=1 Tax=Wolbachia endosymbiont of Laodelphax striatellus TaxID=368602 RepID=UPI00117C564F|nr:hypothetical protein [Wolbachia endosymbiont of Laodelphax striatellus]
MPNKSKINRELVKAFNSILRFGDDVFTNCTVDGTFSSKEDHIVILFDNNMTLDWRIKYLSSMKKKIIQRFCPDESILDDRFYTKFFPFNFDQGKLAEDNKFLVPIRKEVVFNLKFLLASEIARFATDLIKEQKKEDKKLELGCKDLSDEIEKEIEDYIDYNIIDKVFDKGSYLYGAECVESNLQSSFVKLLSSSITGYENGPKKTKDFLEEKGNCVYLKKGVFDDLKFVKDIVRHEEYLTCRCFDTPKGKVEVIDMLKFAVVDLFRKANISVVETERASYSDSDEDSVLIPIVSGSNGDRYLTKEEAEHVNNIFGMVILNNVEGHVSQKLDNQGVYAIDCANPDIAYCLMDKIMKSSLIIGNKVKDKDTGKDKYEDKVEYKLSIDPARVQAMKSQTLAPSEKVEIDGPSGDSGFGGSLKGRTIHAKNSRKLLGLNYYDEDAQRIKDDNSAKDSGLGASSARSSARSNNPQTTFDQPSISQLDQYSAKKRTSISKNSCCIS